MIEGEFFEYRSETFFHSVPEYAHEWTGPAPGFRYCRRCGTVVAAFTGPPRFVVTTGKRARTVKALPKCPPEEPTMRMSFAVARRVRRLFRAACKRMPS